MVRLAGRDHRVVLDACVLAPMPLCDTLLRCAEEPALYRVLWSAQTLEEVARTLRRFGYSETQAARRIDKMREAFPEATVSAPAKMAAALRGMPDPNDRHVVAAAIRARAGIIVTANLRHFPPKVLIPYGIVARSPDDFLADQFRLDPKRIVGVLDMQAVGARQTRSGILDRLRAGLPNFVGLVSGSQT